MSSLVNLASTAATSLYSYVFPPSTPRTAFDPNAITLADITTVHNHLLSLSLPPEISLQILDLAEYWLSEKHIRTTDLVAPVSMGHGTHECASLYTHTPPLTSTLPPIPALKPRKVRFVLRSRDQGWSDDRTTHGTFRGSFSWLEASIFIEDDSYEGNARREPLEGLLLSGGVASRMPRYLEEHMEGRLGTSPPPLFLVGSSLQMMMRIIRRHGYKCRLNRWTNEEDGDGNGSGNEDKKITWPLQRNRVAASTSTCEEYVVEWTVDGGCVQQGAKSKEPNQDGAEEELSDNGAGKGEGFVQALQSGDRIGIWARAKYPGWQNIVESAEITVYYAL